MRRSRDSKGRFLKRGRVRRARRRRASNPVRRRTRRRHHASTRHRRSNPIMARRRRRSHRRRTHHRRRNPPIMKGLLPDLGYAGMVVGGGVAAKFVAKYIPIPATFAYAGPVKTFAAGAILAFLAGKIAKQPKIAAAVGTGAAVIALYDAIKMSPLGAQLGMYASPGGYEPVVAGGIGMLPGGFLDSTDLSGGSGSVTGTEDFYQEDALY